MKRFTSILLAATMVASAAPAFAKDICLTTGFGNVLVFKSPKKLKAGGAVPVHGISIYFGIPSPFDGSAIMAANGTTVRVGLFVHGIANASNNYTMEWTTDSTFAGSVAYDNNGDFNSDGTLPFSTVDCATVTIP